MKALLSISYGCVLAAITPGLCQATASDVELPRPEVALNAPDNGSAPPAINGQRRRAPRPAQERAGARPRPRRRT